jgi:HK97 family phage major capsid protein
MPNKDAVSLYGNIEDLKNQVRNATSEGDTEKALKLSGQVELLNKELGEVLNEQRAADADVFAPADLKPVVNTWKPRNMAEGLLGERSKFVPLNRGESKKFVFMNDGETVQAATGTGTTAPVTLDTPLVQEQSIPGTFLAPAGFLSTIGAGTTAGDIEYFTANEPLEAGLWKVGERKLEQTLAWEKAYARVEAIAHWIPISKPTLQDYSQLQSLINNELMMGYERKKNAVAVRGENTNGIVGILNNTGVQAYTAKSKDTVIDSIKRMATASTLACGYAPNHICMSPEMFDELALMKATDGSYLNFTMGNTLWALPITIDVNFKDAAGKHDILVYNGSAATFYTQHGVTLEYGTINEQFVYNELSVLVEGSHALKVSDPKSFVKLSGLTF